MDAMRDRQLEWLEKLLSVTGLKQTQLAERAGIDPSALSKFKSGATRHLRERNINRLSAAAGVAPPDAFAAGMTDGDATPFDLSSMPRLAAPDATTPRQFAMRISSDALHKLGFETDDILIFDADATPHSGDIVCAQIIDQRLGDATTVIREFERPYLLAPDAVEGPRVLTVDGDTIQIRGVLSQHIRVRNFPKRKAS